MKENFWNREREDETEVLIVDGYVDEPSMLGVPPYISPEPRMIAGVLEEKELEWEYITADEYRVSDLPDSKIILVHGGVTVPGKYLSGTPLSKREARDIGRKNCETYLGGPLARYENIEEFDHIVEKDLSAYFNDSLKNKPRDRWVEPEEKERWLIEGAKIVKKHPMYPDPLIAEMSMYRGCPRYFTGGCDFCSEPAYGKPNFREQEDIVGEIKTLYELGINHFRLGGQSCTLSYKAKKVGEKEVPIPQPTKIRKLFQKIWQSCPNIEVLHLDNANPAVIASYPERSKDILKTLVEYTTAGNILALGLESADPQVIEKNNLNANLDMTRKAVEIINEVGKGRGKNGMPKLLPGINFLAGLKGEREETFEKNFKFLKSLLDEDLWLRRINIRQVLSNEEDFHMKNQSEFEKFKKKTRERIDKPLLKKMFPKGTVLKNIFMEKKDGSKTFGRQVGTYPLLIGVEYPLDLNSYYNIMVTDHGYRSITGIQHPLKIPKSSFEELKAVPGIGSKRAAKIFRERPQNKGEFLQLFQNKNTGNELMKYLSFD